MVNAYFNPPSNEVCYPLFGALCILTGFVSSDCVPRWYSSASFLLTELVRSYIYDKITNIDIAFLGLPIFRMAHSDTLQHTS